MHKTNVGGALFGQAAAAVILSAVNQHEAEQLRSAITEVATNLVSSHLYETTNEKPTVGTKETVQSVLKAIRNSEVLKGLLTRENVTKYPALVEAIEAQIQAKENPQSAKPAPSTGFRADPLRGTVLEFDPDIAGALAR